VPSRVGGDEFLVLLEDLRAVSDSALVAERLLDVLSRPHEAGGHRLSVTVSIGIATCERSYPNATEVIRDADTAMYRVKSEGGGSYAMFDLAMHAAVNERLVLVSRLRDAVRANDIALHYQPVVRLADGRLVGFEALARWNHPELGQVPPAQFIAIAEETGLIQTLGAQMLRKACVQLALWRKRHPEAIRGIRMSVNVSRKQLTTTDLAACVGDTLQETGVEANALALEVTEGLVMDDLDGAVAALNRLRKIGLELHMDDFGTGYTSLIHLYRLPMAAIKIDRAFIVHAAAEPSHQRVLEAIMNIAKAFHLTVVGEGIETVEQFELLRRLGVELGQGYFFGRPVPAEQAERVLLSGLSLVPTSV
jgi:predicted signal transduction protein with EAL and GGDEF domain